MCWCTSEAYKYNKRNHNGGHDDFLLNFNIGCKKHTADLALTASWFSHALLRENLTIKWWLWSRAEARNFIKNKFFNSTKLDFLFAGLTLNLIIQKKVTEKMHILWMMLHNTTRTVVLNLFHPVHPFNRYSQLKSPLRNLVCKEHFYISTIRRETKLFPVDKLNYTTF